MQKVPQCMAAELFIVVYIYGCNSACHFQPASSAA